MEIELFNTNIKKLNNFNYSMKEFRRLLLFFVVSLTVLGCNDSDDSPKELCELSPNSELIKERLLNAYSESCESCLKDILNTWQSEIKPKANIPDSIQLVYDVYKEFYSPWALERMSNSEWGNGIYKDLAYYIIQDSIGYDNNFRGDFIEEIKIVKEFRPEINNDTINLLYLNKDYADAINCFLGTYEFIPHTKEEKQLRYAFLKNYLQFFHGHWGNHWHLETHPKISRMSFNTSKDSVQVFFRLGYQGGEVVLGKNNEEWKIKNWKMTWIE